MRTKEEIIARISQLKEQKQYHMDEGSRFGQEDDFEKCDAHYNIAYRISQAIEELNWTIK